MADTKISGLTALTGANVADDDVLPIVDTSVTTTKKITRAEMAAALKVIGTVQATTSGVAWDFTIPSWAKEIKVMLSGFSTNGTSVPIIQLGDAGGIENSGYLGASNADSAGGNTLANHNTGFAISSGWSAAIVAHGCVTLRLLNAATFLWTIEGITGRSDAAGLSTTAGSKALSAALTTVRLTMVNGTDAGDAGSVNVIYS